MADNTPGAGSTPADPTPSTPNTITEQDVISFLREYIRPAADQWARSGRSASELLRRDKAHGILARLQALAAEQGPDTIIGDGRNDCRLSDAIGIIIVGMVVDTYLSTADQRMGGTVPETVVYRVAGVA